MSQLYSVQNDRIVSMRCSTQLNPNILGLFSGDKRKSSECSAGETSFSSCLTVLSETDEKDTFPDKEGKKDRSGLKTKEHTEKGVEPKKERTRKLPRTNRFLRILNRIG